MTLYILSFLPNVEINSFIYFNSEENAIRIMLFEMSTVGWVYRSIYIHLVYNTKVKLKQNKVQNGTRKMEQKKS